MRPLGRVRGDEAGPTLILVGGMHGNEPAGVAVAEAALARLEGVRIAGEVVAFAANTAALAAGRRYLERDLNRQFTDERLALARTGVDPESVSAAQLAAALDGVLAAARGPVYALDLHTTSAEGVPFAIVGHTKLEHAFAAQLVVPGVMGLHESLEGVLGNWLAARGAIALAIEGGQHQSPTATANLAAVVTLALGAAGICDLRDAPSSRATLSAACGDLPRLIEVVLRHEVHPHDGFIMEPGFINIQRTPAGTLLARDNTRELRAPFDGLVLLPLYQPLGSDGFFYGKDVSHP